MDMVHVSPPWVPLSAGCRQFLLPTGQTSPGLGWVRATCLLEVQETVISGCPHAFPLFYVFPVTKISKEKWALGPNHDAVSGELDWNHLCDLQNQEAGEAGGPREEPTWLCREPQTQRESGRGKTETRIRCFLTALQGYSP